MAPLPRHLLALLLAPLLAHAQPNARWLHHAWQTDDGLPNNDVTAVAQALDGAMLFATPRGLARFDGWRMRELETGNPPRSGRSIRGVLPARDGALWIASGGELLVQRPGKPAEAFPLRAAGGLGRLTALIEGAPGEVWVSFEDNPFFHATAGADGKLSVVRVEQPASTMLARDRNGAVWAIGPDRVARWWDGGFETVVSLSQERRRMCAASGGGMWIGSPTHLLHVSDSGELREVAALPPKSPMRHVSALLEDRAGRVWFGTFGDGLHLWDGAAFQRIALSQHDVLSLCEDREGNVWAGTGGGGVCRVRPRVLAPLDEPGAPVREIARSLCVDARGDVWVALQSGQFFVRRNGKWQLLEDERDWPGRVASCLVADRAGNVWIGTFENDLVRWNGSTFTAIDLKQGEKPRRLRAAMVAADGELWLARGESLVHGRADLWPRLSAKEPIRDIVTIAQDAAGQVWAGSAGGRLVMSDGAKLIDRTPPEFSGGAPIRTLLPTPDGALWIGTAGAGLARWKEERCTVLTIAHGLHDNVVSQLALDAQGRVWCAGDRGISVVPLDQLNAVADGRASSLRPIAFGRSEDLPGLQANSGYSPNVMAAPDGRIWFATRSGIAIADPSVVGGNRIPPVAGIDAMRVNGALVQRPANIGPGVRQVQFELSAPSFTAPEHVRLFHRLEGLDTQWTETPPDRTAGYAHLKPGAYTLRVRAENNDGVPSERDATLSFAVFPFVWETAWFRFAVAGLGLAGALFAMHLASERRLRRQAEAHRRAQEVESERTRIARDIHDQLGANLTQISMISDLAQTAGKPAEYLPKLAGAARQAVASLDEIVWAVNPRHDNFASLLEYLAQQGTELLGAARIRCRLEFPTPPPARHLPADFRHHLFLIVREALNNAAKYAGTAEVRIRVQAGDALHLAISDDGGGFDEANLEGEHNGLANMRARSRALGGECRIASAPGAGTTVSIRVPWPGGIPDAKIDAPRL